VGGPIRPGSATGQGQPRLPHLSLIVIAFAMMICTVPPPSGCRAMARCARRHRCTCCSLAVSRSRPSNRTVDAVLVTCVRCDAFTLAAPPPVNQHRRVWSQQRRPHRSAVRKHSSSGDPRHTRTDSPRKTAVQVRRCEKTHKTHAPESQTNSHGDDQRGVRK
jgi:hypothetical protein